MTVHIEESLIASKWRFAKKVFDHETFRKFRHMQIDAFKFQLTIKARGIEIANIDYEYDKKSTYFLIEIPENYIEKFYGDISIIWNIPTEDMPIHRNDRWDKKRNRPVVSEIYRDAANNNLVLRIKLNPNSKRYHYPQPSELKHNDDLTLLVSEKYYEMFLK